VHFSWIPGDSNSRFSQYVLGNNGVYWGNCIDNVNVPERVILGLLGIIHTNMISLLQSVFYKGLTFLVCTIYFVQHDSDLKCWFWGRSLAQW
jgi:hypothetical protein